MSRKDLLQAYIGTLKYSPELIQPHLADLVPEELIKRVRNEFYNPQVIAMANIVLHSIFARTGSLTPTPERIKYWFRHPEQIGAESVEGYAMKSELGQIENSFILKAPRDPANSDILHELLVGLYGTNRLRPMMSNFAYIFGGFNCSAPIIQPRSKIIGGNLVRRDEVQVVSYCEDLTNVKSVPYVIYENINPAVSMAEYVKTCTGEAFLTIFRQVVLALRQAWISVGFVHNDLHHENILIQKLSDVFSFPYNGPQAVEFVNTQELPRFIDFGRSHITYETKHYGFSGLESVGVFEEHPLPIIDVYKLLLFCLQGMLGNNNWNAFNQIKYLVSYFLPELDPKDPNFDNLLLETISREREDVFYYLVFNTTNEEEEFLRFIEDAEAGRLSKPINTWPSRWAIAAQFDFDDFLTYMGRFCQCRNITTKPLAPLAYCRQEKCGDAYHVINSFFDRPLNIDPTPEDFFEFYDLYTNHIAKKAFKDQLVINLQPVYRQMKENYFNDLYSDVDISTASFKEFDSTLSLVGLAPDQIASVAAIYRENFILLAGIISNQSQISYAIKYGDFIGKLFGDDDILR